MKIALSSSGKESGSLMSRHFGRCAYFAFYDDQKDEWDIEPNPAAQETSGAGIMAAQHVVDRGADVVLTGEVGPKAWQVLNLSPVQVFRVPEVPLYEAVTLYRDGKAQSLLDATTAAHSGIESSRGNPETGSNNRDGEGSTSGQITKIALATDHNEVAAHFGRCEGYTLVEYSTAGINSKTFIPNPGHEPGFLPRFLGEKGIDCIIAGGMGPRAQQLFAEQGIDYVMGVTGPVDDVVNTFISGELTGGESLCEHDYPGGHPGCEN